MRKPVPALEMTPGQREVLESLARSQSGAHREVVRAKALLMAADGLANTSIARALSVSPGSVSNWRARFTEDGVARLGEVRKGRGRKASIPQETIERILDLTQNCGTFRTVRRLELSLASGNRLMSRCRSSNGFRFR
ncbi:winged helix-turn helix protein [Rhodococcus sp. SMB37]|nr:winged helix-turn helix protein [Rhodococcus sp. SMB37]